MSRDGSILTAIVGLVAAIGAPAATALGAIVYVDDDAPGGGDGLSWITALTHLQDAFDVNGVTEIRVAQGIYRPDETAATPEGDEDRNATFQLLSDVPVLGGFAGLGAADPDARDIVLYETILSGDLAEDDDPDDFPTTGENSRHVVTASGVNSAAVLEGFTITAGHASGPGDDDKNGGGLLNIGGDPTIIDCTFDNNYAQFYGIAMYSESADVTVTGCTFRHNAHDFSWGGAFYVTLSQGAITNCTFVDNTATAFRAYTNLGVVSISNCLFSDNTAETGAAAETSNSDAIFSNCTFSENHATVYGGAVQSYSDFNGPHATFDNCTFIGNTAGEGGAFYNSSGHATISNCTFESNFADQFNSGGGAIHIHFGSPMIEGCFFQDNSAAHRGGAILNAGGVGVIRQSTFVSNTADEGGAVALQSNFPNVLDCIFENNSATVSGGAMFLQESWPTYIDGCTFTGNIAPRGGAMTNRSGGNPKVSNCRFEANLATDRGGAIYNLGGSNTPNEPQFTNCVIFDNAAQRGGGVYSNRSRPTFINCTIVKNQSDDGGVYTAADGKTFVRNSIVKSNSGGNLGGSGPRTVRYSNIGGGHPGTGNINVNPMFVNAAGGDLRLLPASLCIDAGKNSYLPPDALDLDGDENQLEATPFDISGSPRVADGDGDSHATVDIGAFEVQP